MSELERQREQPHDRARALPTPGPAPTPALAMPQDPLETIARLETARSDGDGLLELMLARGEEPTRVRAAEALGRLSFPEWGAEVTLSLVLALNDPAPLVRAQAAFALGMRADPDASTAIAAHWSDPDATVRARLVGAASRLPEHRLWREILHALNDPELEVRQEAALAPHRWTGEDPDAAVIDSALIEFLAPRKAEQESGAEVAASIDVELTWRILFSLQQRKSERARAAFEHGLISEDARARIFSAQGLGKIPSAPSSVQLLCAALADADWRVVCEAAVALGRAGGAEACACLVKVAEHKSAHVRRAAIESLAAFRNERDTVAPLLPRALADSSSSVRASGWVTRARLFGDDVAAELDEARAGADPIVLAGVAQAYAYLSAPTAVAPLLELSRNKILRVAEAGVESLGQHDTPEVRARLRELLASPDNGLRLAALEALRKRPSPDDLARLKECFDTARGDGASEVAFNVLENAAAIGGDDALVLLLNGLLDADPFVRKKAQALLDKHHPGGVFQNERQRRDHRGDHSASPSAHAKNPPAVYRNPRVTIRTSRGSMTFELFADEAPAHVRNFLELAKRNHYDNLIFHRVVPDFVIQGGDYRGDGNGSMTWNGEPLRAEFTPRAYVRGSLGMPRNEDPDSGGGQIFVTHRETPHLDGRYTIFGELRDGFAVLDAIEVGDSILDVEVAPAGDR